MSDGFFQRYFFLRAFMTNIANAAGSTETNKKGTKPMVWASVRSLGMGAAFAGAIIVLTARAMKKG